MNTKEVLPIVIRAVIPTTNGCALFLGDEEKVFVIYIDPLVGNSINQLLNGEKHERPLTHDLMGMMLTGLGAKVDRVIINDLKGATYYGRMIISVENELQQRKLLELDARPSDCLAMASLQNAPIYITLEVWNEVEDMSEVLKSMESQKLDPE
ncbi:MAG: bifunctional nuclease family protein [bacterium]